MEKYVPLKTSLEVGGIRKPCGIIHEILASLTEVVKEGTTTEEISSFCEKAYETRGARSALIGYRGFPGRICTAVNHIAAHGIPDSQVLSDGDIVTVDITLEYRGWHGDAAWTYAVGRPGPDARRLLKAAWQATARGCRAARAGGRFGDIGAVIQKTAERFGCTVLDNFVGHGIGRDVHEEPMVLNSGESDTGRPVVPGLVFTVEPILTLGLGKVKTLADGWTVVEDGGGLCAQFEHTVAVFGDRTDILTFPGERKPWDFEFPPY